MRKLLLGYAGMSVNAAACISIVRYQHREPALISREYTLRQNLNGAWDLACFAVQWPWFLANAGRMIWEMEMEDRERKRRSSGS